MLAVGAVLAVVALPLFQPWKLMLDERVAEALPTAAPAASMAPAAPGAAAEPVVLAGGELIAHEHVFDDGRHVDLGDLKGNIGSSNYPLPPEVDLAQLSSVSIWCQRLAVSFAAAALEPVAS